MASPINLFFNELKADAEKVWNEIKEDAAPIIANIEQIVETDLVADLRQIKDFAMSTILEIAKEGVAVATGGNEAFGQAVTKVFQHAEKNAINIGMGDVSKLVQDTYNALALTKPAAAAPAK